MLSRVSRTVLGTLVPRCDRTAGRRPLGAGSVPCPAESLTLPSTTIGLDGPMPATIALVVAGRFCPSPGRVPGGAPSDRAARPVVAGPHTPSRGGGGASLP